MKPWENKETRRTAYKKQCVSDMSTDEMMAILITPDGRGDKMKAEALETLLKELQHECKCMCKE